MSRSLFVAGRFAFVSAGLGVAFFSSACGTEAYCFECVSPALEAGSDAPDAAVVEEDAQSVFHPDAQPDSTTDALSDGPVQPSCEADTTTSAANCGYCGHLCNLSNAFPKCEGGVCKIDSCADGFVDRDGADANGCEYQCTPSAGGIEVCDGADNDCNGAADDGVTDIGQACQEDCPPVDPCVAAGTCGKPSVCVGACCGVCTQGKTACVGGHLTCAGSGGTKLEVCNGADDNCDGRIDEGFDTGSDPMNCGVCGNKCSLPNAVAKCVSGNCVVAACLPGTADLDPAVAGCEYTCPVDPPTAEVCNGLDDDCNGAMDDNLTAPPASMCIQTSICAGTNPVCTHAAAGWKCDYQAVNASIEVDGNGVLQFGESLCDGIDGNCNGQIDEGWPNKGQGCAVGTGICQGVSTWQCKADKSGVECPAQPQAAKAVDEVCNGLDDNCDGSVDERTPAAGSLCSNGGQHACKGWTDATVRVGNVWVYAYEASRPGAGATDAGADASRACSVPGVQPWATVNYADAAAACAKVKDSTGASLRLCSRTEWATACKAGSTADPVWAYGGGVVRTQYSASTCNAYDNALGKAWATGSGAKCYAPMATGSIFDLSGNLAEWTSTPVSSMGQTYYGVMGGAYDSLALASGCTFEFVIQSPQYAFYDLGFRCCADHAP